MLDTVPVNLAQQTYSPAGLTLFRSVLGEIVALPNASVLAEVAAEAGMKVNHPVWPPSASLLAHGRFYRSPRRGG